MSLKYFYFVTATVGNVPKYNFVIFIFVYEAAVSMILLDDFRYIHDILENY